jgi:polyhydroxybutyrate depolymerase
MTTRPERPDGPFRVLSVCVLVVASIVLVSGQKVAKQLVQSGGDTRTYYRFIPEAAGEVPLVILLHGSGRDGTTLIQPWLSLAKKEGFALAAPDALVRESWSIAKDGPEFLKTIVDAVRADARIDGRRMYLFGHSAGGHHGIDLALLESEYLAAAAVHAGALTHDRDLLAAQAERKIPIAMWNGTIDRIVPVEGVRLTRDFLVSRGFDVKLTEIPRHTHDYYGRSAESSARSIP